MQAREWLMLAIVIVGPLLIAVIVTLWTLEQAIKRNARNRGGKGVRRVAAAVDDPGAAPPPEDQSSPQPAAGAQDPTDGRTAAAGGDGA